MNNQVQNKEEEKKFEQIINKVSSKICLGYCKLGVIEITSCEIGFKV